LIYIITYAMIAVLFLTFLLIYGEINNPVVVRSERVYTACVAAVIWPVVAAIVLTGKIQQAAIYVRSRI